jgi:hypothetical protein
MLHKKRQAKEGLPQAEEGMEAPPGSGPRAVLRQKKEEAPSGPCPRAVHRQKKGEAPSGPCLRAVLSQKKGEAPSGPCPRAVLRQKEEESQGLERGGGQHCGDFPNVRKNQRGNV